MFPLIFSLKIISVVFLQIKGKHLIEENYARLIMHGTKYFPSISFHLDRVIPL